jgi:ligand-binding sensor domain-containing protein
MCQYTIHNKLIIKNIRIFIVLISLGLSFSESAFCQWTQVRWNNTAGVRADVINSGLKAHDNHLWFGTNQGLYNYDPATGFWSYYNTFAGLTDNYIYSVFEDLDSSVWIATDKGISHLSINKMTSFTVKEGLSSNLVRAFTQTPGGTLMVGTFEGGVCAYTPGSGFKRIPLRAKEDTCILSLLALSDTAVLIGTFQQGIDPASK